MKLNELLINQELIVQLVWGEQKIEFSSYVIENDGTGVFVTPYIHDGSPLELNVTQDNGVVCNIFTDDPSNNQRISWRNVELTTSNRAGEAVYYIRAYGFNFVSEHDDRRLHERIIVEVKGQVFDGMSTEGIDITIHDISDIGISFHAPTSYVPKSSQIMIAFSDKIDDRSFEVKVECAISRMATAEGKPFVGCRVVGDSRDYKIYGLIKRLREKNRIKTKEVDKSINSSEEVEAKVEEETINSEKEKNDKE